MTRDELQLCLFRLLVATVVVLVFSMFGALLEWIAHG